MFNAPGKYCNWLCFLAPVESHYKEMFKGPKDLENTSCKQEGE